MDLMRCSPVFVGALPGGYSTLELAMFSFRTVRCISISTPSRQMNPGERRQQKKIVISREIVQYIHREKKGG